MKPLNGTKTHPLSVHALAELRELCTAPIPACGVNPGVSNRLLREALAETVMLPSPFKVDHGKPRAHLKITHAGRLALQGGGCP